MKPLKLSALVICVSLTAAGGTQAKTLTYHLDTTFSDGGSIAGNFSFDPSTFDPAAVVQSFATNWNFVTTPGTILPGATYTPAIGFSILDQDFIVDTPVFVLGFDTHPFTTRVSEIQLQFLP